MPVSRRRFGGSEGSKDEGELDTVDFIIMNKLYLHHINSQMPLSYADPGANLVLKKVSEEGLDLVLESEKSRATATVVYKVIPE